MKHMLGLPENIVCLGVVEKLNRPARAKASIVFFLDLYWIFTKVNSFTRLPLSAGVFLGFDKTEEF